MRSPSIHSFPLNARVIPVLFVVATNVVKSQKKNDLGSITRGIFLDLLLYVVTLLLKLLLSIAFLVQYVSTTWSYRTSLAIILVWSSQLKLTSSRTLCYFGDVFPPYFRWLPRDMAHTFHNWACRCHQSINSRPRRRIINADDVSSMKRVSAPCKHQILSPCCIRLEHFHPPFPKQGARMRVLREQDGPSLSRTYGFRRDRCPQLAVPAPAWRTNRWPWCTRASGDHPRHAPWPRRLARRELGCAA